MLIKSRRVFMMELLAASRMARAQTPTRTVEIGDSKQSEFFPQAKLTHWDNEVNLSMRLGIGDRTRQSVRTTEGRTIWEAPGLQANFYSLKGTEDSSGFEFEVILLDKPGSRRIPFSLNTKGIDMYYQAPLTADEIAEGVERPDHAIGSWAAYHSTKKGNQYRAGKAWHLYRPWARDANGKQVWCDLNISSKGSWIDLPADFWQTAVYPVLIDPTFGYTSIGASNVGLNGSQIGVCLFTGAAGTLNKIVWYGRDNSGTFDAKGLLYADDGSSYPGVLTATSDVFSGVTTSAEWRDLTFSSPPSITAVSLWLGYVGSASSCFYYYDAGAANQTYTKSSSYSTPANPFGAGGAGVARIMSIYGDYTSSGGAVVKDVIGRGIIPPAR